MTVRPHSTRQSDGWTPVPDPTQLTTEAVDKATEAWTQLLDRELKSSKLLVEAEINHLTERVKDIPNEVRREVSSQQALLVEKMNVINAVIDGMKELATALKSAADAGINAAFLAADKVVQSQYTSFKDTLDKTNESIVLRIGGIERQLETMRDESRLQMEDNKARVVRLETAQATRSESKTEGHAAFGSTTSLIVTILAGLSFAVAVLAVVLGSGGHGGPTVIPGQLGTVTLPVPPAR